MHGLHLTADLLGCPGPGGRPCSVASGIGDRPHPLLTDLDALEALCRVQVAAVGLTAVDTLFHRFALPPGQPGPAGITGVVLLAESHVAVHTWPELGAVTIDVYVCNFGRDNSAAAERLLQALVDAFEPQSVERHRLERGRALSTPLPLPDR